MEAPITLSQLAPAAQFRARVSVFVKAPPREAFRAFDQEFERFPSIEAFHAFSAPEHEKLFMHIQGRAGGARGMQAGDRALDLGAG